MNYYPFHIGDYASATRHLSWDEDAAYRRLLDAYYVREGALPLDMRQVYRLVMAQTNEQREAVETVLREFFVESPEGWKHGRCESELDAMRVKRTKAAQSAKARWTKADAQQIDANASESHANACQSACEGNAPNTNTNTKRNTPLSPQGGEGRFGEFWDSWPSASGRKQDRKKCLAKWKRHGWDLEADRIVAHVVVMAQSKQWRDGYDPAPLTYLNGERWKDGTDAPAPEAMFAGGI